MNPWTRGLKSFMKPSHLDEWLHQPGLSDILIKELNGPGEEPYLNWCKVGIAASVLTKRFTVKSETHGILGLPGTNLTEQLKEAAKLMRENRLSPTVMEEIEAEFEKFTLYSAKRLGKLAPEKAGQPEKPEGMYLLKELPKPDPILKREEPKEEPKEPAVEVKPVEAPKPEKKSGPLIKLPWYLGWSKGLLKKGIMGGLTFLLGLLAAQIPVIGPYIDDIVRWVTPLISGLFN